MKVKVLNTETQIEVREMNLDDWIDQSGECSLGRSPHSGLVLDSPDVSRLHAKFAFESGHYYFYDLGSSNGSMLNGKVVTPQQKQLLRPGDIIRVGEFMLTLYPVHNQSESLAATVIGGAEMTVLGQLPLPHLDVAPPPLETAELQEDSPSDLQPEQLEPAVAAQLVIEEVASNTFSSSNALTEEAVAVDLLDGDVPDGDDLPSDKTNQQSDTQASDLISESSTDDSASQPSASDFTVIQLEPSVDLSESSAQINHPSVETTAEVLPEVEALPEKTVDEQSSSTPLEEDTDPVSDSASTETLTLIQRDELTEDGLTNLEADSSTPILHTEAEAGATLELSHSEPNPTSDTICESQETITIDEVEITEAHLSELLLQSGDGLEGDAISTRTDNTLGFIKEIDQTENEIASELEPSINPPTTNLDLEISSTKVADTDAEMNDDISEDNFTNVEERAEEPETETTETTEFDTHIPASTEQQPISAEKYVALLAHDGQSSALAELVANHKAFLTHCLTIATPSISEVLKQQAGFEVSCQTPAIPVGGYQTINSLITSDKVSAVIFLRDFLDSQANSANDEAFSRSCNIHQVLFASNFPTAGVLMQHLQHTMTKQ